MKDLTILQAIKAMNRIYPNSYNSVEHCLHTYAIQFPECSHHGKQVYNALHGHSGWYPTFREAIQALSNKVSNKAKEEVESDLEKSEI